MHKAAGIIIKNKSLLMLRTKGKNMFFAPGGKLDPNETSQEALIRELKEEIKIEIDSKDVSFFNDYIAPAAGNEKVQLKMSVFMIHDYSGEISPSSEIDEIAWVNSTNIGEYELSSIFKESVFPALKELGEVD